MSKITKNVITTKTKYDNTASYQGDDTNAYVPLTDVLVAGEGVSVTTDAQGRVVVSASGGGGGGGLNKYTFNFTPTSANKTRLENIVKNAKGRIYIDLFDESILYFAGLLGSTTCFNSKQYDLNYIAEYQLVLKSNRYRFYTIATTITGTTPSMEMTDLSEALEGQSIPITYFNDAEITQ